MSAMLPNIFPFFSLCLAKLYKCCFHYLYFHDSPYYKNKHDEREILNAINYQIF